MKVAFVYANSWEYAYPQHRADIDRKVWCDTDDFIVKYPRAVQDLGVEPVFFYLSETATSVADFTHKYGFRLRRVPVRLGAGRTDRECSLRLLREVRADHCDLVHFYSYYRHRRWPDMYDLFALYARLHGLPFVAHYQVGSFPSGNPDSRLKQAILEPRRRIKKWALNQAARIFSLNRLELRNLTDPTAPDFYGYAFPETKCVYVPNIVDRDLFSPMSREEACRACKLDPGHRYILFVGFFREAKGVQHMLEAMPGLLVNHPDVRLLLVGDGPYEGALREQIAGLGLADKVVLPGPVPNSKLRAWYNAADVHILPSHTESFGNVLIEAMSCNTPSVGAAVGGIPEVLSDDTGLLVPPGDAAALGEAVERILSGSFRLDPEKRDKKLNTYSYKAAGRILLEEYTSILEAGS